MEKNNLLLFIYLLSFYFIYLFIYLFISTLQAQATMQLYHPIKTTVKLLSSTELYRYIIFLAFSIRLSKA